MSGATQNTEQNENR